MANYVEYIKPAGGETYQIRDPEAARKSETDEELDKRVTKEEIFNLIYPVGAIYLSATNVNPGTIFGGTWEQIKDRFLLSAGDTYAAGSTGGATSYRFTAAIGACNASAHTIGYVATDPSNYMKSHRGATYVVAGTQVEYSYWNHAVPVTEQNQNLSDGSTNIIPPYLSVYVWKRVE